MSATFVDDYLLASAARHGDRVAVVDGARSVSYADLAARSGRLSDLLRERGIRRGDRVGLFMDKSLEAIVGIYGILRSGAAYVPLDPQAPPARVAAIAANADLRCLITGREKSDVWQELLNRGAPFGTVVVPNAAAGDAGEMRGAALLTRDDLDGHDPEPPPVHARARSDLAYILYTSGSTGVPKGVMLSHANATAFVDWAAAEFGATERDRLSSHAPLHFDLSVLDLYVAAKAGAELHLVPGQLSLFPSELARWIRDSKITMWYSVPSILTLLVLRGKLAETQLPELRTVLFAGEVFPTKYLHQLMQLLPHVRFANLFGPTETNVCTWYEVPRWSGEPPLSIPIGRAACGDETFAVLEDGSLAAPGEVGELYVRGPSVMQGYWGDPERTAATLLPEWRGDGRDTPADNSTYRTGDLVRLDENGDWIFLGRRDAQIKSRGYRIELGDIEAALALHPSVVECAVVPIPDEVVTNRIKAYVVVRDEVSPDDLVSFVCERLPRYMAPELFEFREELPRSSTGKVDRRALPADPAEVKRVE